MSMQELMLMENPYSFYKNPRKKARKKRSGVTNLSVAGATSTMKRWTKGVTIADGVAGLAGMAAVAILPSYLVKTTTTTGQKFLKLGASLAITVVLGMAADAIKFSPNMARAAIIGGLATTGAQAIGMFTNINTGLRGITGPRQVAAPQPTRPVNRYPAPAYTDEFNNLTLD